MNKSYKELGWKYDTRKTIEKNYADIGSLHRLGK